jgi:hypothetical protein
MCAPPRRPSDDGRRCQADKSRRSTRIPASRAARTWGSGPADALLALGLATPLVSSALALICAWAAMSVGAPLHYASLLFLLLAFSGAGRWSLDAWWHRLVARRPMLVGKRPHVVIVGAGFGGCASGLKDEAVDVTLLLDEKHAAGEGSVCSFRPIFCKTLCGKGQGVGTREMRLNANMRSETSSACDRPIDGLLAVLKTGHLKSY